MQEKAGSSSDAAVWDARLPGTGMITGFLTSCALPSAVKSSGSSVANARALSF